MKRVMLISLLAVIAIGGCGPSYRATPVRIPIKPNSSVAIREFAADSPATAQMIRATLVVELQEAGLHIVDVNDSPDLIVDGTITKGQREDTSTYVDSVLLLVATPADEFVTSLKLTQAVADIPFGPKTPGEIGTELGKRLARKLKKK